MIDITTWEVFFDGSTKYIGKRTEHELGGIRVTVSPIFELVRTMTREGVATMVHPVAWMPIDRLALPLSVPSIPVSSLPPEEKKHFALAVAKADEILQQMRAAASGIALAREMPKGIK